MFFTHNTQYSLLFLIHVQIQCDLAITSFTCVNVCSLNCLDLFLKYKIGYTCLVCVCVLEILVLKNFKLRDYFERFLCWLDHWLSCMLDCIHICVFLLSKNCFEKLARHLLDTSSIPCYLSSFSSLFLIAISTPPRYLVDRSRKLLLPR